MAANPARELLLLCILSWVPGFIMHRVPWPGPGPAKGLWPRSWTWTSAAGCPSASLPRSWLSRK